MRATRKDICTIVGGGGVFLLALLGGCAAPAPTGGGLAATGDPGVDWQARWEQTLQAGRKEGKVVVVTHTNLYYREQLQKFNEKYPDIQVEHVPIRPSEFAPKVITEQQNGIYGYDVWVSATSNMVEIVVPAGGFDKLPPYLILAEVTDTKNWRGGALLYATSEPHVLLNRGNVAGSAWVNRDLLPRSEFNNLDQLLDPKLKGKIAIRTPSAPHGGSLIMTGFVHTRGEDFVSSLMIQQQPVFIDNARLLTQNLINGKYPVALGTDGETLDNCQREGGCKNLEEVRGYPYLLGHGVGVLKNPPNPNAAAVFTNWFFSREGQETFVQSIVNTTPSPHDAAHSIRTDIEPHQDAVELGTVPDYAHLEKYSLQGMEAGASEMQAVLALYRRAEAGGGR